MKVYNNLDIVFLRPSDSLEEEVMLSLGIWFARNEIVGPIPYRDAYVIESSYGAIPSLFRTSGDFERNKHPPSTCDCFEVVLCDPCFPMLKQFHSHNIGILVLPIRPLVDDEGITSFVK
jgi:hypothetical protein